MTHLSFNRWKTNKSSWNILIKLDPAIKFMLESNQQDGAIPFLDTIVKPEADNTLLLTVYRKPIHTDQYLQWDSHHNLVAKYNVMRTLTHSARTVCSKSELFNNVIHHLRKDLTKCKYPKWTLDNVERKFINNNQEDSNIGNNQADLSEEYSNNPSGNNAGRDSTKEKYNKGHILIPYTQR